MRVAAVLLSGFLAAALCAGAQVSGVHSVYLLPMSGHLDQHLAHRLTSSGLFQVVTDPQKADAIFSDQLGPGLENRLKELFPEAKPEAEPAKPNADADAPAKDADENKPEPAAKPKDAPMPVSSFGRGKGTTFLVDGRNRTVLWSFYENPKNTSPQELERVAEHIVNQLKRDLKKK